MAHRPAAHLVNRALSSTPTFDENLDSPSFEPSDTFSDAMDDAEGEGRAPFIRQHHSVRTTPDRSLDGPYGVYLKRRACEAGGDA